MKEINFVIGKGSIQFGKHPDALPVSVLGYKSEHASEGWIARALEIDLTACGETFEQAFELLSEAIAFHIQVSAGKYKNLSLVYNPAPMRFWEIYLRLREQLWRGCDPATDGDYRIGYLPIASLASHAASKRSRELAHA